MMNNKLPPSYGAIEDNVPPPKNEEISGEGPSNETTIEMPFSVARKFFSKKTAAFQNNEKTDFWRQKTAKTTF